MEFRVLEYFLVVAEEENITKAAQRLYISQPTLSRQLMQLEEELEVKLFKRSNHKINLTKEGMLLKRRAEELVELSEKTKKELIQNEKELVGEIFIGSEELRSVKELAKIIKLFHKKYPLVKFHLKSGNNDDIRMWLEQGRVDFGLLMEPVDKSNYNYIKMEEKEEWGVLVNENSEFIEKEKIMPGELVGTQVITISDKVVHQELVNWSGKYAKEMDWIVSYNLFSNGAMLAKEGIGPVICIKRDTKFEGLKYIPLEPKLELTSILVWKEHIVSCELITIFIDFIKKYKN